jgi:hypothetical protein
MPEVMLKEPYQNGRDYGELRCINTLELLGYWFVVGKTTYYGSLENFKKKL